MKTALGSYGSTARTAADIRSANGGNAVVFQMGEVLNKNTNKTVPIYWQVVYQVGDIITIWMTDCYTIDCFNTYRSSYPALNLTLLQTYIDSSYPSYNKYSYYSNYSQSVLRDLTNAIYLKLAEDNPVLSKVVKSPNAAGATWQKTEAEDVKADFAYYCHHNNLWYDPNNTSYGGSYAKWTHSSNWNFDDQPYYDEFWIPSISEVYCNLSDNIDNGLWRMTDEERGYNLGDGGTTLVKSLDGSTYLNSSVKYPNQCWLRSGSAHDDRNAFTVIADGCSRDELLYYRYGVRPACHLSLSAMKATFSSTVTLNKQGGSGGTSSVTVASGSAIPSITIPTRSGYTFGGYYTGTNGTGTQYYTASGTSARTWDKTGNVTLYAKWTASNYTVVFDVSGYQNKVGTLAGGFENTGWGGTYDTAHVRSGSYALKITSTTSNVEVTIPTSSAVAIDSSTKTHIYYFQYWGYQETAMSNATTQIYWPIEEPSFGSIKLGPAGQWNQYSFYGTRSSNALSGSKCVRIDFDNRNEAGTIWFDDLIMLDLTEIFGSGNEPSKDWCDKNIVSGVYTQTIQYDTATALTKKSASLTADGFTFKGWSTTARTNTTQPVNYTDGQSVTNIASAGGSATLYGVWSTNNYLVSAKINKENAGSISNGSQGTASGRVLEKIYSSDSVYVLPANTTVPVISVVSGLALEVNQKYLLSLNYVATGTIQFDIDFYPDSLPQYNPTATTTEQLLDWEFTPTSTDCASCMLRLFNDIVRPTTYAVTITNVAIYKVISSTTQYDYIYMYNSPVSLTAMPSADYFFEYWEIDGATSGTSTTLSFNVTANKNIVAHFKLAKTYSYSTAGGEIRLIGNDFQGGTTSTTATYKAVPYAGYYLIGWSVNGEVYKPSGTIYKERTLTLSKADSQGYGICAIFSTDANATPTPSYDVKTGTAISAQLGGEARAVGCDLSTLADTDTVTYIAVTDLGYNFDGWYIDGAKVNENLSCRLTKSQVLGKIVEARFSANDSNINDETNNTDEIF